MINEKFITVNVIKNKIYRKSENINNMYKNTLLKEDEALNIFNEDIKENKVLELQKEIKTICDIDNIFSFSDFEIAELKRVEKIIEQLKNKETCGNVSVINDFIDEDTIKSFNIKILDTLKKIKSNTFELSYLKTLKNKHLKEKKLGLILKVSKDITKCEDCAKTLQEIYKNLLIDLQKINIQNLENYLNMLNTFCEKEKICDNLSELEKHYSTNAITNFVANKIVYLLTSQLDSDQIQNIIDAIEKDEQFKENYAFVINAVIKKLRNVGTNR